jgi:hypothetical protein
MFKKSIFFSLFMIIAFQSYGQGSYINLNKRINKVTLLYFQDETDGMERIQPIYSKARGVTGISAINNVNNRALRKLRVEAAMLGADAVYITNNYQKGVQFSSPVQVSYSALAYTSKVYSLEEVKAIHASKAYYPRFRITYNRNSFSEKVKILTDISKESMITNIHEEDGVIWADFTRNNVNRSYRVIIANGDQIILSRYQKNGKIIENIEFVNADQIRNSRQD